MSAPHPSRKRWRAAGAASAGAILLGTVGFTAVAGAEEAAPQPVPEAPADSAPLAGAELPFVTQEAEDAEHGGSVIGPDVTQGTVASEASGRSAVELAAGQSVTFTLTEAANATTVVYNVPEGTQGSLTVEVNGQAIEESIPLSDRFQYFDAPWIAGSTTHHFFTHERLPLGQDLAAGDTVSFVANGPVTLDGADFEQVAAPAEAPAGALDVTELGADPTGQSDSSQAFVEAVAQGRGGTVWIPPGTYQVNQPLYVENVTIRGAGSWHSVVHSSRFVNQGEGPGDVHISDFAVIGDVTERVDSNPDNFVNGSLGPNSSVSGMWLQHLKVGLWLTGNNDDLVVERNRIVDMAADGLNLNGNAHDVRVRNNYLRNTGDDALAMWSLPQANSGASFDGNTVIQPNLANGIAIYGGENIQVTNNYVRDTNALGSGIAISNQAFMEPFFPLSGTITVDGNTLVSTGALNPNWDHPMSALRVDAYNHAIEADINITDTTVLESPWSAFQFVSGSGTGLATDRVTIDGAEVDGVGTVVVQAETTGEVTIQNVTATDVGAAGVYNCPFPTDKAPLTINDGGGNTGLDTEWDDCETWPQPE
ncbi:glycosyl hydrolase family 28-related protein [Streptomyces sp. NBRC 109706]|uniref:glycosyl hydrolase family 28-related protein n=1 Tax=Streptomyces sp. NBRC 109706 TaxID=1550035 RepID=UPI00099D90E2|nr:glycosyl hydrolase family 28-related protein [Streptomyces sp. NBRC 109706]